MFFFVTFSSVGVAPGCYLLEHLGSTLLGNRVTVLPGVTVSWAHGDAAVQVLIGLNDRTGRQGAMAVNLRVTDEGAGVAQGRGRKAMSG